MIMKNCFQNYRDYFQVEILRDLLPFSAKYIIEIGLLGEKGIAKCNLDKDFAKTLAENS